MLCSSNKMDHMEIDIVPAPLPELNEDVLFEIFKCLSCRDRKSAKLVCKQWARVCNYKTFLEAETIFIPNHYNYSDIEKIINIYGEDLNLKFENRKFFQHTSSIWKNHGYKIQSLHFYNCTFYPDIMPKIFKKCVNLKELTTIDCSCYSLRYYGIDHNGSLLLSNGSNNFVFSKSHFKLKREKLILLHLSEFELNENSLKFIASAFPNIKSLKMQLSVNFLDQKFQFLKRVLETQMTNVEEVHLNFSPYFIDNSHTNIVQKFTSISRIKNVRISVKGCLDQFNVMQNVSSILSFQFWTSLSFKLIPSVVDSFVRFLSESPQLQELKFDLCLTRINDFRIIWSALVESRLKCLQLRLICTNSTPQFLKDFIRETHYKATENHTVQILSLYFDGVAFSLELSNFIVKHFRKVCDLILKCVVLSEDLQYPPEISSLCVVIKKVIVKPRNTMSSKISIESVEFLNIKYYLPQIFSLYRFPNLKYLTINFASSSNFDSLLPNLASILSAESPKLESIKVECSSLKKNELHSLLNFCCNLNNIRYIWLDFEGPVEIGKASLDEMKNEMLKYLNQCPFLRVAWLKAANIKIYYFFNAVTGTFEFFHKYRMLSSSSADTFVDDIIEQIWRNKR